jgi:hypothetical protein
MATMLGDAALRTPNQLRSEWSPGRLNQWMDLRARIMRLKCKRPAGKRLLDAA